MLNVANRTLFTGDNLDVMRGINSECIDLIYLDPPFNSDRNYAAPIGSEAAGAAFKDTWTLNDVDLAWHGQIADEHPGLYAIIDAAGVCNGKSMKAYLIMMGVRLLEIKRILKPVGSVYLHCDPTASHYLKMCMDAVFGKQHFKNEIVWCYSNSGRSKNYFPRKHDTILWYSKSKEYVWTNYRIPISQKYLNSHYKHFDEHGRRCRIRVDAGKKRYYYPEDGITCPEWWSDISSLNSVAKERLGYPTQKPLKLIERIIKASSLEGQTILDPFCGCVTACVAAENLQREWIGIDISPSATSLLKRRMSDATGIFGKITHRTDIPVRTDVYQMKHYSNFKNELYGRQEGKCAGCGVLFPFRNMTVDHIIPKSKGGQDNEENLQLLCGACNSMKGDRDMAYLLAKLQEMAR